MANAQSLLVDLMKGRTSLGALLELGAEDIERLVDLGRSHLLAGRLDDAQRVFDGLCALEPSVAALHQLRGVALDRRGLHADAARAFTRAVHLLEDDDEEGARAVAYASRGIARLHAGEPTAAFADLALARPRLEASAGPLVAEVDRLLRSSASAASGGA